MWASHLLALLVTKVLPLPHTWALPIRSAHCLLPMYQCTLYYIASFYYSFTFNTCPVVDLNIDSSLLVRRRDEEHLGSNKILVQTSNLKSHLSAAWCLRLTPQPPRTECALECTEKPCALGFSVRFGLKRTLRCVIWVKSWKLEALIWAGSGVTRNKIRKQI